MRKIHASFHQREVLRNGDERFTGGCCGWSDHVYKAMSISQSEGSPGKMWKQKKMNSDAADDSAILSN